MSKLFKVQATVTNGTLSSRGVIYIEGSSPDECKEKLNKHMELISTYGYYVSGKPVIKEILDEF
ncbi:hypothetical protein N9137_03245 [Pseudomonadales bacterium]|nr:hypothetical protein [Pseudomonadales bacterium]